MDVKKGKNILLSAVDIKKKYSPARRRVVEVLKGISLDIYRGETVTIVGPSGAGKSTLLHILGGLDKPDEGKVYYDTVNIFSYNDEELARFRNKDIGFVFQFHHLLPEFTALENVFLPGIIGNGSFQNSRRKAENLLQMVGLGERLDHFPSELSGGEQQRVAVARALINNPAIIFADEPSGNLDRKGAEQLHDLLWELNRELNTTLFIVTHNVELTQRADRSIRLLDGQIANN